MRREWIEIPELAEQQARAGRSPSMRREWIEIMPRSEGEKGEVVSLHAEGVD